MQNSQLFSRRNADQKVDFRPNLVEGSPDHQLRRLSAYLASNVAPIEDINDCDDAIKYLREFAYRKTFTGTTHEQFMETDTNDPIAIDWLLAVAQVESTNFQNKQRPRT